MFNKGLLITSLTISLIILLFAVSVLGENHRAQGLIDSYLDDLENGNFSAACLPMDFPSSLEQVDQNLSCEDRNFIFTISLISIANPDWAVQSNQSDIFNSSINQYWLPYFTQESVNIGVSFPTADKANTLDNLFLIKREGWSWTIAEINMQDIEFAQTFITYQNSLNLEKYVIQTSDKIQLKDVEIDFLSLTPLDKMVLKYNLQKVYQGLE
ncbi:hypothetical protein [Glaciecola sp. 1036]|uniref:hypothetical protein n=1 Tax=Alteromonadaceae TaxID=72275 RepID=UPI003D06D8B3